MSIDPIIFFFIFKLYPTSACFWYWNSNQDTDAAKILYPMDRPIFLSLSFHFSKGLRFNRKGKANLPIYNHLSFFFSFYSHCNFYCLSKLFPVPRCLPINLMVLTSMGYGPPLSAKINNCAASRGCICVECVVYAVCINRNTARYSCVYRCCVMLDVVWSFVCASL